MNYFKNATNQRLMSGNLPECELLPVHEYSFHEIDMKECAKPGLKALSDNHGLSTFLFNVFANRLSEYKSTAHHINEFEINAIINLECDLHDVDSRGEAFLKAVKLNPVTTEIDEIVWFGANSYYNEYSMIEAKADKDCLDMLYCWIYLLQVLQEKEIKYNKKINLSCIKNDYTTDIHTIILMDWDRMNKELLIELSSKETKALMNLKDKQLSLKNLVKDEWEKAHLVARETEESWILFINYINHLSTLETDVINTILENDSSKEKLQSINNYKAALAHVNKGYYYIENNKVSLLDAFEDVYRRFKYASTFCRLRDANGQNSFIVHPALFILAINPKTYNNLFLMFHQLRLSPDKHTSKEFLEIANLCVSRNLLETDAPEMVSFNDMIEFFYNTVETFINRNKEKIKQFRNNEIEANAISLSEVSKLEQIGRLSSEIYEAKLKDLYKSVDNEKLIETALRRFSRNEMMQQIDNLLVQEQEMEEYIESRVLVRQIIITLNSIYLFCEALRIMLNDRVISKRIKDITYVKTIRNNLLKLDDYLVHNLYLNDENQGIDIFENREKKGIITNSLTQREQQEEKYRNSIVGDILKTSISSLVKYIEKADCDELFQIKSLIKEQIRSFPECDEKEQYADWLDSVTDTICNMLVNNCKTEDVFAQQRQQVYDQIGSFSEKLPRNAIDTLTTAEMLYKRYASPSYSHEGFDFSCISALYYQAFENAYNFLIWKEYAEFLNNLCINEIPFTDIMHKKKYEELKDPSICGYLDSSKDQRRYYINYASRKKGIEKTSISEHCMYGSFAILMGNIKINSKLDKFCSYFSNLTGFKSVEDMLADSDFMEKCTQFVGLIDYSTENRNNASHGGSYISMEQCACDKDTVLSRLDLTRCTNIGLIQLLLHLLNYNHH